MKRNILMVLLIAVGILVYGASTARADLFTETGSATIATNLTASGSVVVDTGTDTYTGSLTFTDSSAVAQMLIAWSLQIVQGDTTLLTITANGAGWTDFFADDKLSNNGTPCNTNSVHGWICADGFNSRTSPTTFTPGIVPGNGSLVFTFNGTFSGPGDISGLDLMANGCQTTAFSYDGSFSVTCPPGNSNKWAFSSGLPGTVVVPEPASMALIGSGLLGLAGILRRRFLG